MLGSNMEEISVQTRRREIEPTTRGKDMEKGMRDLREQMQDLREGMLVSQVQLVSHEEQVKQELAIYKAAVSTQAMATQEASRAIALTNEPTKELRRRGIQDLATATVVVESLMNYNMGDSSKVESLEDINATGRGDGVSKGHNAHRMGSTKTPNVREGRAWDYPRRKELTAMIKEREQEDKAHMGLMQLLGALQVNLKPSTPKTSLLSRAQVNEAKGERNEVARTHMDKVTKGKVNLMGKRKQHSKHRKCKGLHPSKASREEVKNILVEWVTRRQGVPPMIEYLVRWK
ncbi:hypothetical protein CK203_104580 [Vitis vinifera]|uniref:Uncharacterized protein n=1 Tax=Vitis vinifera TaxID=29760 RepID=A0A438D3L6_VITVI|nr:hypothetical protein CK203_104580 [Vitis vinifera]